MLIGKNRIITHRGLEPSDPNFFGESTLEAFENQLSRGFGGIEFDPNITKDGIIIWHDSDLSRASDQIPTFRELMQVIKKNDATMNALHLKGRLQTSDALEIIINALSVFEDVFPKLIVFDVMPKTAKFLKRKFPSLRVVPSIAHPYDVMRFGKSVGNTLITIEDALQLRSEGFIDGVWADEWDTQGSNNTTKQFYTKENFDQLHDAGLFIALVTPELHNSSPGLYGGESHPDAKDLQTLFRKIKQIKNAGADYFCTDYPEEVARL